MAERDFLDEMVSERARSNPDFPRLLEAAARRRELLQKLAYEREQRDLSQTEVAARMQTSQSAVARLERSDGDARLSTIERLATALGVAIEYQVVPASSARKPSRAATR
jgi:ribosome-binding protein aMBF1 (putative translation factor)